MSQGIRFLENDEDTKVIVLVSKPPAPSTAEKIFALVKKLTKPVVIFFLGGDQRQIREAGAHGASTLEEAALMAMKLANQEQIPAEKLHRKMEDRSGAAGRRGKGQAFRPIRNMCGVCSVGEHTARRQSSSCRT